MKKLVIFTDLDGTLLDYSAYSFEPALQGLKLIREKNIPLVFCSSKTKKEIEYYRGKIKNNHPFITENGGGIFIPKGYFDSGLEKLEFKITDEDDYLVIRLGAKYADLRKTIKELVKEGFDVKGFGDMTPKELADLTNMSEKEAEMAKVRDFDEPFIYKGPSHKLPKLLESINKKGFKFTQGKFYHILGSSNKGMAVSLLIKLYKIKYGEISTIAIGDSPNDIPMLQMVDHPVVVQKFDGSYDSRINVPNLLKADGIGPVGWNQTINQLIKKLAS